jgi:hypothetical protein
MPIKFLAMLSLALAAVRLEAQGSNTDSLCNAADHAVEHVRLPAAHDTAWFRWYTLSGCTVKGARAAAAALRTNELRHESDDARLGEFFRLFGSVKSGLLLDSFQDAAEDNGATEPVRLHAIESMTGYVSPGATFDPRALSAATPGARCAIAPRIAGSQGGVNDLPNDVFGRVLNSVRRVANKASAMPRVQRLANCWQGQLELQVPVSNGQIQLTYVCENKFRVHNGNTADVIVRYAVLLTTESSDLTVLGGEDLVFETGLTGSVQLTYNGAILDTKSNTNKKCP